MYILTGSEIRSERSAFKTELFSYQSKTNLDAKGFFGKISQPFDPEIRKML